MHVPNGDVANHAQVRHLAPAHPLVLASQTPLGSHAFQSGSARQATTQRLRASAAAAAATAIDPNSHRVIDTELRDEAEKSYLAVRACCWAALAASLLLIACLSCYLHCFSYHISQSGCSCAAVRDVGDCGPSAAGCARRPQAGASAHPVRHARAGHDVGEAAPQVSHEMHEHN